MEFITLFHIPDGKPRTIAATAWQAMQGTPKARNYKAIPSTPPAPKPPEVLELEERLASEESVEDPIPTKKKRSRKQN